MSKSTIMSKRITKFSFVGTLACTFMVSSIGLVNADGHGVYGPFPITEKSYNGSKKNSVSYGGQIARQLQHNALKKLASKGNSNDPKTLFYNFMGREPDPEALLIRSGLVG